MTSKTIQVDIISAFIYNESGGNPAGVVFNADKLSDKEKLFIAGKVGLSETAFVSKSSIADLKLDFFTPTKQIPHCGHATIAVFSYLQQKGYFTKTVSSKETIDGTRKIVLRDELAFMEQLAPTYISVEEDMNDILLSLQLNEADLVPGVKPCVVNTGNNFLLVGLKEKEKLKNIIYNIPLVSKISEKYGLIGYYVFTTDTELPGRDASARMFGPFYGIPEEAATGMAAGPLACYLYDILKIKKQQFFIEQGNYMNVPSPSLINVELSIEQDKILGLLAGGKARFMRSVEIQL